MPTQRLRTSMRDPIGTALAGIGIRGSAPTRSFLATEFSTARLAGDFTLRSTLGGGHSDTDSGTATDSPGTSIITSTTTITLGVWSALQSWHARRRVLRWSWRIGLSRW